MSTNKVNVMKVNTDVDTRLSKSQLLPRKRTISTKGQMRSVMLKKVYYDRPMFTYHGSTGELKKSRATSFATKEPSRLTKATTDSSTRKQIASHTITAFNECLIANTALMGAGNCQDAAESQTKREVSENSETFSEKIKNVNPSTTSPTPMLYGNVLKNAGSGVSFAEKLTDVNKRKKKIEIETSIDMISGVHDLKENAGTVVGASNETTNTKNANKSSESGKLDGILNETQNIPLRRHKNRIMSPISYRKIFYDETADKWFEHRIFEEDLKLTSAPQPDTPTENAEIRYQQMTTDDAIPRRVKGRKTSKIRGILPTAFVKMKRCPIAPYHKIEMTDQLRMELHKRNMPVVPTYFQEHLFKFGKLPFRGNPRPR